MIQEIITFIIVGAAVVYAFSGFVKKPARNKKQGLKTDFKKESFKLQHHCAGCSADCMLRDSVKHFSGADESLCKQIEVEHKL